MAENILTVIRGFRGQLKKSILTLFDPTLCCVSLRIVSACPVGKRGVGEFLSANFLCKQWFYYGKFENSQVRQKKSQKYADGISELTIEWRIGNTLNLKFDFFCLTTCYAQSGRLVEKDAVKHRSEQIF